MDVYLLNNRVVDLTKQFQFTDVTAIVKHD